MLKFLSISLPGNLYLYHQKAFEMSVDTIMLMSSWDMKYGLRKNIIINNTKNKIKKL